MKNTRVSGHTLRFEGNPYNEDGTSKWNSSAKWGCGKCSCGALSEVLPSRSKRKQWHREHKAEVAA